MNTQMCQIALCRQLEYAAGLCAGHHAVREALSAAASAGEDCIEWSGRVDANGYGRFSGKWAHRLVYEQTIGAIPPGLELDHLCRNPICCNPRHLEPVTHQENMRRAGAAVTHCVQGHEYTVENTYFGRQRGERNCRACNRERARARMAKERAGVGAA